MPPRIAVLIPCYNEEAAIAKVVRDFRTSLGDVPIYVYDNNSTDRTAEVAAAAGALVRLEPQQGKGHVVRRMFRDIEADFYVMVDGDDTYDAALAPQLLALAMRGPCDLVNGVRREVDPEAYRGGHRLGNALLTGAVRRIFGDRVQDMLSGYKVLSRRYVKSFPALAQGFDIETELTVHALELDLPVAEMPTPYYARPKGSVSKLNTWRDGFRILMTITRLYKSERPVPFFAAIGAALQLIAIGLAIPIFVTYLQEGLVPRLPTAVLATGLTLLAFLSAAVGLVLGTVTRGRREMKLLAYLQQPAPGKDADSEQRMG